MCRTKIKWPLFLAIVILSALVTCVSACGVEDNYPVPTEGQVIGSWSNPGGDWIKFQKGGTGLISRGAQLQLSALMKPADTKDVCTFSWGVDTVPGGGGKWVSVNIKSGQCRGGEFGLYSYHGENSGELFLSPAVEYPEHDEVYSRSKATPSDP